MNHHIDPILLRFSIRNRIRSLGLIIASTIWLGSCDAQLRPTQALAVETPRPTENSDSRHANKAKLAGQDSSPKIKLAQSSSRSPIVPLSSRTRTEDEQNTISIFRAAAPATVFVTQSRTVRNMWAPPQEVEAGSGSGFIWDRNGHIVTNAHVVGDTRRRRNYDLRFKVTTYDGTTFPARFVGYAPNKDLAVLKIDAKSKTLTPIQLPPAKIKLEVGQKTLAIGNPFGLDHTLTTGVISAIGRQIQGYGGVTIRDMIQTDATINPGNSGGPLLNSAGELIGINTMIYSKTGTSAGIGFAVPVTTIRRLIPQLIRYGKPRQVGIGVSLIPDRVAQRSGIEGVIIRKVARNRPAARAGLRSLRQTSADNYQFDTIVAIDDQPIRNYDDLYNALEPHEPGDQVTIHIIRGNKRLKVPVKLEVLDSSMQDTP